jgi:RHS repeat-associated protein
MSKFSFEEKAKNNPFLNSTIYSSRYTVYSNRLSAFGTILDNRNFGNSPRVGFNGKEKDSETVGTNGNTYDYGFRIYNPSLGRFLSVDPLTKSYPWYTPYQFAGNKVIMAIDLDGLEEKIKIFAIHLDGSVSLIKEINNIAVSEQTIQTPHGKEKLMWNISKNRLADGNDFGSTQYKYFQETTDGSFVETEKVRTFKGELVQREGKENPIIPDYTENTYTGADFTKNGSTYIGPNNPETVVNGKKTADYRREPIDLVDAAALQHDKDYDAVHAEGAKGAFIDLKTLSADLKLVKAANDVIVLYKQGGVDPYTNEKISEETYNRAVNVSKAFSILAGQKLARIFAGEPMPPVPNKKKK